MSITQAELGRRLREAREACGMTQAQVGQHLGLSRPTVAQIELGNRAISGLELSRLAYLFGKDIRELVAEEAPHREDALVALFRLHPDLASQDDVQNALRQCMALGREISNLERVIGVDRTTSTLAAYVQPKPKTKWEAIQQGERIALEERRRLGLGNTPLPDVAELLESQGVRTAQVTLPEEISGLTLIDPSVGMFVVANREHHLLRRRFSFAHEYCHLLLDQDQRGLVSRSNDRDKLLEVRANAFAAGFLMPMDAVRGFIQGLGKGQPSRMEAEVFDEAGSVRARARSTPGSQDIQIYDVVQMAHHFGVSRAAACYRLRSARLITQQELDVLLEQDRAGRGREIEILLGLPEPDHAARRDAFRRRFLGLALEAFRRGEISYAKLVEVATMVEVDLDELARAIDALDLEDEGSQPLLPAEQ